MHLFRYSVVAWSGLWSAAALLAAEVDLSKLPPPAKRPGLSYAKDIQPILEGSCFGCHGADKQKGDLRVDSLAALLKGGEDGKVVVPGKSQDSPLVVAVSGLDPEKSMPPKRRGGPGGRGPGGPGGPRPGGPGGPGGFTPPKDLTPEQVGLIRAWIDQGAKP